MKILGIRAGLFVLAAGVSLFTPMIAQAYADDVSGPTEWRLGPNGLSYPVSGWKSCAEARANTAVPILRGEPGFNPALDPQNLGRECA